MARTAAWFRSRAMAGTSLLGLLALSACNQSNTATAIASQAGPKTSSPKTTGRPSGTPINSAPSSPLAAAAPKTRFRVQEVADRTQGGLVGLRFAVPQDWRAGGRF